MGKLSRDAEPVPPSWYAMDFVFRDSNIPPYFRESLDALNQVTSWRRPSTSGCWYEAVKVRW